MENQKGTLSITLKEASRGEDNFVVRGWDMYICVWGVMESFWEDSIAIMGQGAGRGAVNHLLRQLGRRGHGRVSTWV